MLSKFTSIVCIQYAYVNAIVVALGGFISSWLGGRIATAWISNGGWGSSKANYIIPALGCILGIPFFILAILSPNFYVSLILGLGGE